MRMSPHQSFVCHLFLYITFSISIPAPFIKPCHDSDSACLKSSAQAAIPAVAAGVPALGISVLDPMHVERVSTSQAGLDMDFRNTLVKGLKNCKVEGIKYVYLLRAMCLSYIIIMIEVIIVMVEVMGCKNGNTTTLKVSLKVV